MKRHKLYWAQSSLAANLIVTDSAQIGLQLFNNLERVLCLVKGSIASGVDIIYFRRPKAMPNKRNFLYPAAADLRRVLGFLTSLILSSAALLSSLTVSIAVSLSSSTAAAFSV